jgi:hypothetical protein
MRAFEDNTKIPRVIGIFITWLVWTASTMNLLKVMHSSSSLGLQLAVTAGFFVGNYVYAQLWIAEGRAREQRDCANRERHGR